MFAYCHRLGLFFAVSVFLTVDLSCTFFSASFHLRSPPSIKMPFDSDPELERTDSQDVTPRFWVFFSPAGEFDGQLRSYQ